MTGRIVKARAVGLAIVLTGLLAVPGAGQSLLDRPPNISGDWVSNGGTVQFNFLHRFVVSDAPVRKVSNFPTFLLGIGLPVHTMVGLHYATNSTLAPQYPNEWEFFARHALLAQDRGAPLDVAGQVGYNLAAEGVDGEVSLARRIGPLRLIAVTRILSDPFAAGETRLALGGGATLRLSRFVALAGDYATLTNREADRGEQAAWSAGLHVALPSTPHTLSIQVTNTNTSTLQGLSRGDGDRRYGFEFTVPITLARFFGRRSPSVPSGQVPAPAPAAMQPPAPADSSGPVVETVIRGMKFPRSEIEVQVGTTIVWTNEDPLAHTVTARDGTFDSGLIEAGGSWRQTFTRVGRYEFFCTPHPFMTGVVIVRGEQ